MFLVPLPHAAQPTLAPTAIQPDGWIVSLEGKSYDIKKDASLDMLAIQIKEYAGIFAHNLAFPELDEAALFVKLNILRKSYSRKELEAKAIKKCKDFVVPTEMLTRDTEALQRCGSIRELIASSLAANKPNRFNGEKAKTMFGEDTDFVRIFDIATHGARLELPPEFVVRELHKGCQAK